MADPTDTLALADYRRRVHAIYGTVRELHDPCEAWLGWQTERDRLFAEHPQSPVAPEDRSAFERLQYFSYNPAWRFEDVAVEAAGGPALAIHDRDAAATAFVPFGRVRLEAGGEEFALTVYWLDAYGGGLFLPFRDGTSGRETYGGGRYLLDTAKGADLGGGPGALVLDFNFAYHPSCVYDARWSCPLAPPENRLAVRIAAGERL